MASQLARLSGNAVTPALRSRASMLSVASRSMSSTTPDNFTEVRIKFGILLIWYNGGL